MVDCAENHIQGMIQSCRVTKVAKCTVPEVSYAGVRVQIGKVLNLEV